MRDQDTSNALQTQLLDASAQGRPLRIVAGNSKQFYAGQCTAPATLNLASHSGVIDYEPSELVISVRSGTPLAAVQALLAAHGQMLAFEPPAFGDTATIGGTLACGFSGPRRPYAGSARDFTLGCRILNGRGELLNFGGRVMKNVAGFDVSRLMVGALGSLGVLLELSLRVLPLPEQEQTRVWRMNRQQAAHTMQELALRPWPLSAMAYDGEYLRLRLAGASRAVHSSAQQIGGDLDADGNAFWQDLREQKLAFFTPPSRLWRISQAPAAPLLPLSGDWLIDWGGALRWLRSDEPPERIYQLAAAHQAHALIFRHADDAEWLKLPPTLAALHSRIRKAFDPQLLLNPGRLPV